MQREKELQLHAMECRIRKLTIDQDRAEKALRKTLDYHDEFDSIKKRREDNDSFRSQWLGERNHEILEHRNKNRLDRDARRQNLNDQKKKLFIKNWYSKKKVKEDASRLFEVYQANERNMLEQRDARVQRLYLEKRKARQQEVLNYTTQLLNVRNAAEQESLASIERCD